MESTNQQVAIPMEEIRPPPSPTTTGQVSTAKNEPSTKTTAVKDLIVEVESLQHQANIKRINVSQAAHEMIASVTAIHDVLIHKDPGNSFDDPEPSIFIRIYDSVTATFTAEFRRVMSWFSRPSNSVTPEPQPPV